MSAPVTIVVRRRVRRGREADYESWLKRLTEGAARGFRGYLGAEFHRPHGGDDTYRSVFRFDSIENLEAFETSAFRAGMLAEATSMFAADAAWERLTGLEFWFDAPPGTRIPQPSPHRMALVLIGIVSVLVLALTLIVGPVTAGWPLPLRVLLTATIQVGLMTYVIMPRLTPAIARFIYPAAKTA